MIKNEKDSVYLITHSYGEVIDGITWDEESYTSGTSFLDNEDPIKENYKKERRVYRGLFVSNDGKKINADVNGAYQIMKKVIPDAFSKGIEGAGLHPTIINLACSR